MYYTVSNGLFKVLKTRIIQGYLADSAQSPMRGVDFRLRISPRIQSQNRKGLSMCVRDLCLTDIYKKINLTTSLITNMQSQWLPVSTIQGVDDFPYQWLPVSTMHGVADSPSHSRAKLSIKYSDRDSPQHWKQGVNFWLQKSPQIQSKNRIGI